MNLDATDRAIVQATPSDLPLAPLPCVEVAGWLHLTKAEVMALIAAMQAWGVTHRLALAPNHYALGMTANGMSVWAVEDNAAQRSAMMDLCDREGGDKFYLSHLVYADRGDKHRGEDTDHNRTRDAMDEVIDRAGVAVAEDMPLEIATGTNDADAVWFLPRVERNFEVEKAAHLRRHLEAWGGNSSGLGAANIDTKGRTHPDTCWSDYTIGSIRQTPFSQLWTGDDALLATPRQCPRPRAAGFWRPVGRRSGLQPDRRRNRPCQRDRAPDRYPVPGKRP